MKDFKRAKASSRIIPRMKRSPSLAGVEKMIERMSYLNAGNATLIPCWHGDGYSNDPSQRQDPCRMSWCGESLLPCADQLQGPEPFPTLGA